MMEKVAQTRARGLWRECDAQQSLKGGDGLTRYEGLLPELDSPSDSEQYESSIKSDLSRSLPNAEGVRKEDSMSNKSMQDNCKDRFDLS